MCMGVACAAGERPSAPLAMKIGEDFTIVGDAVNLTAKLEKHTKMAKVNILTTEELFSLALKQGYKPQFTTVYLPQETVEGVGTPLDSVGLKSAWPPFCAIEILGENPLVRLPNRPSRDTRAREALRVLSQILVCRRFEVSRACRGEHSAARE